MKISRICSSFNRGQYDILIYGYDKNNNFIKRKDKFTDYFYYPKTNISDLENLEGLNIKYNKEYFSIFNEPTYKIYYNSITQRKSLENHKIIKHRLLSSDIKPEHKYLLDKGLEFSMHRHIMFLDIETKYMENNPSANNPSIADAPITSIQLYSSIEQEYYIITWHPEHTKDIPAPGIRVEREKNINYLYVVDEETVLKVFIEIIRTKNVDILSGWYSGQYDIPYIVNRSRNIGVAIEKLSPTGNIMCYKKKSDRGEEWHTYITGLDHLDMMVAFKDLDFPLSDNKLDTAAREILKDEDMRKLKKVTWRDWEDNFYEFIKYGIRDVEILKELDDKLNIFFTYLSIQSISSIRTLGMAFSKSNVVESYLFKTYWNDYVFQNKIIQEKQEYKAAIVANYSPGNHRNVAIMDYASLYPTVIMAYNLSNETYLISQNDAEEQGIDIDRDIIPSLNKRGIKFIDTGYSDELFGKRYLFMAQESKIGLFPTLERTLFKQRKEIKKAQWGLDEESIEYLALDKQQYTLKIIMNGCYGAFGFPFYRFYKPEIADTITFFARKSIMYAKDHFKNKFDIDTLYIDTDSLFLSLKDKKPSFLKEEVIIFNEKLKKEVLLKHNNGLLDEFWLMDLEHEKNLNYFYLGDKKKRYYCIKEDGSHYVKGLNIIRKDTPYFMRDKLDDLAEKAVKEILTIEDLYNTKKEIENVEYENIGVHKKFNMKFDEYKGKSQHLMGALWSNEKLGTHITHNDVPLLFYVNSKCEDDLKPKDRIKAICLNEEDLHFIDERKDLFEIDYDTYFDKQVISPLEEFQYIEATVGLLESYKKQNRHFYPWRPTMSCPMCGSKHTAKAIAMRCAKKLKTKMDQEPNNNEWINIAKEFPRYINHFEV